MTQEQLDNAILTITGNPEWALVAEFLAREALISRDSCADAISWEDVNKRAGFSDGLAFVLNLREMTERAMEERNADLRL